VKGVSFMGKDLYCFQAFLPLYYYNVYVIYH
jgi:hypothetical protein